MLSAGKVRALGYSDVLFTNQRTSATTTALAASVTDVIADAATRSVCFYSPLRLAYSATSLGCYPQLRPFSVKNYNRLLLSIDNFVLYATVLYVSGRLRRVALLAWFRIV